MPPRSTSSNHEVLARSVEGSAAVDAAASGMPTARPQSSPSYHHMSESLQKFQDLLRTLFQFDSSDLDFGIYQILSHKRSAIQAFVEKDLTEAVASALRTGVLADQASAAQQLEELAAQVRENLGDDALDGDGNLAARHQDTRLGRKYLEVQARTRGAVGGDALEVAVYNHLHAFFGRYYDAGDFISKRRYSRTEKYAVPYNGEEVYLHWANKDQYYIKTSEYFTDYRFTSGGFTIRFKLAQAGFDQDNVRGERRFFVPRAKDASADLQGKEVVVPFEYRTLTSQEVLRYGQRNQQEAINADALTAIPKALKGHREVLEALLVERRRNAEGEPVSCLEHHLRQYTRRNSSDFFIHKNLRSFLERELDFYLKNEVLPLEELADGDEARALGWFQLLRTIRAVGHRIITFLAQIEDFQRRLYEKRKFVMTSHYCVRLDQLPKALHRTVAANDAQWQEWRDLFHIDEEQRDLFTASANTKIERRLAFLSAHPYLILDTRHYDSGFVDQLLASFADLPEVIDGLLVHGENFQALNLLAPQLHQRVRCVYIDPPYNSKTSEILYKNTYKHSSWLSLMQDRLAVSRDLAGPAGVHIVAIDENEAERLGLLLRTIFPEQQITAVSIVHNPRGIQGDNFSYCHDYAYFVYPAVAGSIAPKAVPQSEWEYSNLRNWGGESLRSDGKSCFYPIVVRGDAIVEIGEVPPDDFHPKGQNVRRRDGTVEVWPIDRQGTERKWRYARGTLAKVLHATKVDKEDGKVEIKIARSVEMRKTVWEGPPYDAGVHGSRLLANIVSAPFSFPKSLYTVAESLEAAGCGNGELVLDYFAGSGTTGHAVIHLNRRDGKRRRFVLVEMGQYFDTVLLPRIKKVAFAPKWKDTKPERPPTTEELERAPRVLKYVTLESYDDTLGNITLAENAAQAALRFDDYVLNYVLQDESKDSPTLLNVAQLSRPFEYSLRILRDGQAIERPVDLPETFACLLGLQVRTRRTLDDEGRRYLVQRGTVDHREVVVIWRTIEGWSEADFERDRTFISSQGITAGVDEVFVNGDSTLAGARSLDPVFKARMFAQIGGEGA